MSTAYEGPERREQSFWTQRGRTPRWQLLGAYLLIVLAGAVGFWRLHVEGTTRQAQFCQLIVKQHQDRVTRLDNTVEYLRTDLGRSTTGATGGLNNYIRRVSLPQLRAEVKREAQLLPPVCVPKKQR